MCIVCQCTGVQSVSVQLYSLSVYSCTVCQCTGVQSVSVQSVSVQVYSLSVYNVLFNLLIEKSLWVTLWPPSALLGTEACFSSNNIRQFGSIVAQVESSNQITQIMLFLYFMEFYGILYWFFPFYSDWKQSSVCRTSWMFLTCLWREEGGVHRSVSPSQVAASNECRIFLSILCIFATCLQHRHKPVGLMTRSQGAQHSSGFLTTWL